MMKHPAKIAKHEGKKVGEVTAGVWRSCKGGRTVFRGGRGRGDSRGGASYGGGCGRYLKLQVF
jgi:hypothetical protein